MSLIRCSRGLWVETECGGGAPELGPSRPLLISIAEVVELGSSAVVAAMAAASSPPCSSTSSSFTSASSLSSASSCLCKCSTASCLTILANFLSAWMDQRYWSGAERLTHRVEELLNPSSGSPPSWCRVSRYEAVPVRWWDGLGTKPTYKRELESPEVHNLTPRKWNPQVKGSPCRVGTPHCWERHWGMLNKPQIASPLDWQTSP